MRPTDVPDVRPLTPERFADVAALFEEGGDPKWCWCTYFRARGRDWSNSTPAGNRTELATLVERLDVAPGLVAYRDGRAVGWVSLGPREDYERLATSKILAPVDDTPVWSIVCFVVSRRVRGEGVATKLLAAAIDYARDHASRGDEARHVARRRGRTDEDDILPGIGELDRAPVAQLSEHRAIGMFGLVAEGHHHQHVLHKPS